MNIVKYSVVLVATASAVGAGQRSLLITACSAGTVSKWYTATYISHIEGLLA
jgi:hypothetical protein